MPTAYVTALALSALFGLVVVTIGSLTTGSRRDLTIVAITAVAPAVLVILRWGLTLTRRSHEPAEFAGEGLVDRPGAGGTQEGVEITGAGP
jgi:hypothetical protein